MMKRRFVGIFIVLGILSVKPGHAQTIRVSENKCYLVKADGSPFFCLAATAWELFYRLDREPADQYLKNRAQKGFTVIQAVVLEVRSCVIKANAYDHLPFKDNNPLSTKKSVGGNK